MATHSKVKSSHGLAFLGSQHLLCINYWEILAEVREKELSGRVIDRMSYGAMTVTYCSSGNFGVQLGRVHSRKVLEMDPAKNN